MTTRTIYNWDGTPLKDVNVKEIEDVIREQMIEKPPTRSEVHERFASAIECLMLCMCIPMVMGIVLTILGGFLGGWEMQVVNDLAQFILCTLAQVLIALMCSWAQKTKSAIGTDRCGLWWLPVLFLSAVWACLLISLISSTLTGTIALMNNM